MKDKDFGTAIWSFSWEQLSETTVPCEQGSVGLVNGQVLLEIPLGELLGQRNEYRFGNEHSIPSEVDYLYGFTQHGYSVALKDVWYDGGNDSIPGGTSQRIRAKYLLASRDEFDPSAPITKIKLSISGLNEWASIFPATAMHDRDTHMLTRVDIDLGEKDNRVLLDNEKMTLTLFHKLRTSPLTVKGISIVHDCGLLIKLASPCGLDSAVTIAKDVCSFFSFCNDRFAELLSLSFSIEGCEKPVSCYGAFERSPFEDHSLDSRDVLYPIGFFKTSLGVVFENWIDAEGRLAIARDIVTVLSNGTWSIPLDLAFTTIAQVLESLTKHNVDTNSLPVDQYRSYRKTVLDSIADAEVKAWAENKLNGNSKGQERLLKEFLEDNDDIVEWAIGRHLNVFVKSHIATRNYYIHRGESKKKRHMVFKGEELYWHTWNCILICKLVTAKLMGFDVGALVKATKESSRWSRIRNKALASYASHSALSPSLGGDSARQTCET